MELTPEQIALVERHRPLAYKVSWRYVRRLPANNTVDADELNSVAIIGLCNAARQYARKDVPFAAYAVMRVKGAIIDFLRKQYPVTGIGRVARHNDEVLEFIALDSVGQFLDDGLHDQHALPDDRALIHEVLEHVRRLPARDAYVLVRWCQGEALADIGREFDRSESWACMVKNRGLRQLRDWLTA
jgi:RNA polymerase sigma factor (sigma-70 family)